jgi:Na+-translocating ferredoxin:NAD+ oxidoreductase subunit A
MSTESVGFVFISALLINNFVLSAFLGICPFVGVSKKVDTAARMGLAVTFVMFIASMCAYGINEILVAINAPYLQIIAYIVIIASAVQLVEMFIKRFSPALFQSLGIFLPLITTNCAILGLALFQTMRQYDLVQSFFYAIGAGLGFTLAIVMMAVIREELELADVPGVVKGTALVMAIAGILSIAFMGFAGLGGM